MKHKPKHTKLAPAGLLSAHQRHRHALPQVYVGSGPRSDKRSGPRSKRPGQKAPATQRNRPPVIPIEDEFDFEQPADPADAPKGQAKGVPWEEKMRRQHLAWQEQTATLKAISLQLTPFHLALKHKLHALQLQALSACMNEAWQFHECAQTLADFDSSDSLTAGTPTEVVYFSLACRSMITVPQWVCKHCSKQVQPSPIHVGCWGQTPVTPQVWYDLEVMQMYSHLGLREGLSATGLLEVSLHVRMQISLPGVRIS